MKAASNDVKGLEYYFHATKSMYYNIQFPLVGSSNYFLPLDLPYRLLRTPCDCFLFAPNQQRNNEIRNQRRSQQYPYFRRDTSDLSEANWCHFESQATQRV